MQGVQVSVFAQRIRHPLVLDVGALDLTPQRANVRRQQTPQTQRFSFIRREGHPLVQQRRIEHGQYASLGFVATLPTLPPLGGGRQQRDHSLSHGDSSLSSVPPRGAPMGGRPRRGITTHY